VASTHKAAFAIRTIAAINLIFGEAWNDAARARSFPMDPALMSFLKRHLQAKLGLQWNTSCAGDRDG
jgi:hypothetical protein